MDTDNTYPINRNAVTEESGRLAFLNQTDDEHFHIVLLDRDGIEYTRTDSLLIEDLTAIFQCLVSWDREVTGEEN